MRFPQLAWVLAGHERQEGRSVLLARSVAVSRCAVASAVEERDQSIVQTEQTAMLELDVIAAVRLRKTVVVGART